MNKLKLVGLDMDGTLLGKDRILTQHTIDTMEKVAATGVHLVVDSGRKFEVVPKELRDLPFMRYFVLSNGAEIYDKWKDKVLYRAEIPFDIAMDIYDSLTSHPEVYLDCYHSDGSWARAEDHARIVFISRKTNKITPATYFYNPNTSAMAPISSKATSIRSSKLNFVNSIDSI